MRRPSIGRNIVDGMGLVAERTLAHLEKGFIPWEWDTATRIKVRKACRYMIKMRRWYHAPKTEVLDSEAEEA